MSHEIEHDRNEHAVSALDNMEEMMQQQSLCDFTIKVGSEEIKAHRVVLASTSDYFRSMLTSDTKQSQYGFLDLINVDFECIKICIEFIYNKKVAIPVDKYENLMYVANMMQLKKLCNYIYTKLAKELDTQLFFATRRIADTYQCKELEEKCQKFAEENFVAISKEDGFKDLDLKYLNKMITSENVKMTEKEKLDIVLDFVRVDKKVSNHLEEMINWVDLSKVPLEHRKNIMENDPLVSTNLNAFKIFTDSAWLTLKMQKESGSQAKEAAEEAVSTSLDGLHAAYDPPSTTAPKKIGGLQTVPFSTSAQELRDHRESNIVLFDEESEQLLRFNPRDNTMIPIKEFFDLLIKEKYYSAIAVHEYVCVLRDQEFHRFKYTDTTLPWEQMPDMTCCHGCEPPVTASNGCMFVCGGSVTPDTAVFEKFDLKEMQWKRLADLPRASADAAVVVCDENVYSIGGETKIGVVNRVQRFNIASSTWTEVAPMKYKRTDAAAVEANGSILVLGGIEASNKVERYCVLSDQWTEIKPMKIGRSDFNAFAFDGAIYAVGGLYENVRGTIEKYEAEKDEWEMVELPSTTEREVVIASSVVIKI